MATLNGAIGAVDLKALDAHDQNDKFDASLKAAHSKLEALLPLLQPATFHLTGNSHIDAAWLWPWTETVDVVKRTFGTALQLMYEYPEYTYTQSAAAYNEWMAQKYPDMNAEIKQRIKEGRWEIVGGMWVEPDLNMPDGESLVRQLLVGKRWYKQAYGVDVRIGWNPDSFGYTWQLPQIYKKSGVDYFVTQKMTWNDTNQLPFKLFWWESPDGSKVLAYFPHDYGNRQSEPGAAGRRPGARRGSASTGHDGHDGPLRRRRSRRRTDARRFSMRDSTGRTPSTPPHVIAEVCSSALRRRSSRRLRSRLRRRARTGTTSRLRRDMSAAAGCRGQGLDSHVEERALLRVPPRRDDHAGQPQAQHARAAKRRC